MTTKKNNIKDNDLLDQIWTNWIIAAILTSISCFTIGFMVRDAL